MDDHTRFITVLWIIIGGLMVLLFVAAAHLVWRVVKSWA